MSTEASRGRQTHAIEVMGQCALFNVGIRAGDWVLEEHQVFLTAELSF